MRSELLRIDAVDLLVEPERFGGRQVPPELVLLTHHEREPAAIGVLALPRHVAQHAGFAGRGIDHAGEQFERRRFARAVGAEEGDEFAFVDIQVDAAHGLNVAVLAAEQSPKSGPQALFLLIDAVRLSQAADFDDGHRTGDYRWRPNGRTGD